MSDPTTTAPPVVWDGVARSYIPPAKLDIDPGLVLHEEVADGVDPVTFEVVRYALMNANLEHSALIQRLCVSPITMLSRDFQPSLLTEEGEMLVLGPNLQYFSTSSELTVKWTLENRSAAPGIREGDMWFSNDPYVGAPHQPDASLAAPLFVDGQLFCWVTNVLHYSDVGGSVPGSFCITATDAFMDPPAFPPIKLVEDGTIRPDIEGAFLRQSRVPHQVRMDLRAAVSGNEVTSRRIHALVERYGATTVKAVMRGMQDAGERLIAERLRSIPDGTWSHRAYTEAALPGDDGIYAYQLNLTKRGDELHVDNRGTDPQAGSINLTYVTFSGSVLAAITQSMTSDLAGAYGGVYRRVHFDPQPGTLSCADYPAAVSPSGALTTELHLNAAMICVGKMLACGDEEARALTLGPNLPHYYGMIYAGLDAAGKMFILANTNGMMGSIAGMPDRDGIDVGGHFWIPEGIGYNVEDLEAQSPVLYLYRRLTPGGADGAGRHRGGRGFEEATAVWRSPGISLELFTNESFPKGQGQLGGNPGSRAWARARHGTDVVAQLADGHVPQQFEELAGEESTLPFKGAPEPLGPGDVFGWCSPATAGYGDPLRRRPEAVLADVTAERLDVAAARRAYGVVLVDGAVDDAATDELRRRTRAERLGRDVSDVGDEVEPPSGARRAGDLLWIVDEHWWCNGCDLGPTTGGYRAACAVRERPVRELGEEWEGGDHGVGDRVLLREYLCPRTGLRIDGELLRAGDEPLVDVLLAN